MTESLDNVKFHSCRADNVRSPLRPLSEGRVREVSALLATALLVMEMWLADQYLGTLMIVTLIILAIGALLWGSVPSAPIAPEARRGRRELTAPVPGNAWLTLERPGSLCASEPV